MAKYKILISSTICIVDKECKLKNIINNLLNEPTVYKEIDSPFEIDVEIDEKKCTEKEISNYLKQKANTVIETINSNRINGAWFKNVKLKSIDKVL